MPSRGAGSLEPLPLAVSKELMGKPDQKKRSLRNCSINTTMRRPRAAVRAWRRQRQPRVRSRLARDLMGCADEVAVPEQDQDSPRPSWEMTKPEDRRARCTPGIRTQTCSLNFKSWSFYLEIINRHNLPFTDYSCCRNLLKIILGVRLYQTVLSALHI